MNMVGRILHYGHFHTRPNTFKSYMFAFIYVVSTMIVQFVKDIYNSEHGQKATFVWRRTKGKNKTYIDAGKPNKNNADYRCCVRIKYKKNMKMDKSLNTTTFRHSFYRDIWID
jgi:hypothetical protein